MSLCLCVATRLWSPLAQGYWVPADGQLARLACKMGGGGKSMSFDQITETLLTGGARVRGTCGRLLFVALMSMLVGACGGGDPLAGALTSGSVTPQAQASGPKWTAVAFAPITGASPEFADLLVRRLDGLVQSRNIALLVDANAKAELTLRGMLAVERKKGQVTIVYLWDVLDAGGRRVNRVEGQESFPLAAKVKDVWAAVPVATASTLADKALLAIETATRPAAVAKAGGG